MTCSRRGWLHEHKKQQTCLPGRGGWLAWSKQESTPLFRKGLAYQYYKMKNGCHLGVEMAPNQLPIGIYKMGGLKSFPMRREINYRTYIQSGNSMIPSMHSVRLRLQDTQRIILSAILLLSISSEWFSKEKNVFPFAQAKGFLILLTHVKIRNIF